MRISIATVGRMKAGNERDMFEKYVKRAIQTGRSVGISGIDQIELGESRAANSKLRKEEEARELLATLPQPNYLVALDETGESVSSKSFAELIQSQCASGNVKLVFVIGGADGLSANLLEKATKKIAFGSMTWPHQLTRIMLAEQIYRATTILTGHPYHRQ